MLVARLTVVAALLLLFGSVVAMVVAGPVDKSLKAQDASFVHARIIDFDQGVRTQLVRLRPPNRGIVRAQRAVRQAIAQIGGLTRVVEGVDGETALRLRVAIAGELSFLDAVGSVLFNGHSPRVVDLPELDVAARRAIAAVTGPRQRRTGGVSALQRLRGVPVSRLVPKKA